jgi:hypothetical protein
MQKMTIEEASHSSLSDAVKLVCGSHETLIVAGPDGELARVVPIPKPVRTFKGRPVYRLEDVRYLDFPYWKQEAAQE